MALNQPQVGNPSNTSIGDGTVITAIAGKQGEQIASELRGKYYTANYRGSVFAYSVAAVTLPIIATTLVSVFSVYNPPGSGKNLELIRADMAFVVTGTKVNGVGLYYTTPANAAPATTFTTSAAPVSMQLGGNSASVAIGYSALTTTTTPVLGAILAYTGATTSTAANPISYVFDGTVIATPGVLLHVVHTTVASTASAFTGMLTWAEVPV